MPVGCHPDDAIGPSGDVFDSVPTSIQLQYWRGVLPGWTTPPLCVPSSPVWLANAGLAPSEYSGRSFRRGGVPSSPSKSPCLRQSSSFAVTGNQMPTNATSLYINDSRPNVLKLLALQLARCNLDACLTSMIRRMPNVLTCIYHNTSLLSRVCSSFFGFLFLFFGGLVHVSQNKFGLRHPQHFKQLFVCYIPSREVVHCLYHYGVGQQIKNGIEFVYYTLIVQLQLQPDLPAVAWRPDTQRRLATSNAGFKTNAGPPALGPFNPNSVNDCHRHRPLPLFSFSFQ